MQKKTKMMESGTLLSLQKPTEKCFKEKTRKKSVSVFILSELKPVHNIGKTKKQMFTDLHITLW